MERFDYQRRNDKNSSHTCQQNKSIAASLKRIKAKLFLGNGVGCLDNLRYANIALDMFCVALSILPIVYLLSNCRYRLRLNQFFLGVCISNIFMLIGDLPDWFLPSAPQVWQRLILLVATTIYYVALACVLLCFLQYVMEYLKIMGRVKKFCQIYSLCLCGIQIVFALVSPFTGAIFYVTTEGYQRGPLFLVLQILPLFCYPVFMLWAALYRKRMHTREILSFLMYILLPLGCGALQVAVRGIAVVNVGFTIATLLILMNVQVEHEITMKEQEKKLAEQRIDIMLSQIQPHFLYNSLGVIRYLCESDPETARKAIQSFSDFLRGNMESLKNREPISFKKELSHVTNYLFLEQQRFGDKLQVIYQIKTDNFLIPPLTLQPLVENAVQHGILNKRNGGTVLICTEETDEFAIVTIADNGIGMEKAKERTSLGDHTHIGIANVRSRLEEMVDGTLEFESSSQGTTVTIRIPLMGDE